MKKTIIFAIILCAITALISSCSQDNIIVPKPCDESPNLGFNQVFLQINTDKFSSDTIYVDNHGNARCNNFVIRQADRVFYAILGGHVCKDKNFQLDAVNKDSIDISRLRITGHMDVGYNFSGIIYYCDNINNTCNFVEIGHFGGFYGGYYGGGFDTPLFSGSFRVDLQ